MYSTGITPLRRETSLVSLRKPWLKIAAVNMGIKLPEANVVKVNNAEIK